MGGTWGEELLLSERQNVIPSKYPPLLLFGFLHFSWSTMHPYGPYTPPLFPQHSQTHVGPTSYLPCCLCLSNGVDISSILGDKSVKIKKKNLKKFHKMLQADIVVDISVFG